MVLCGDRDDEDRSQETGKMTHLFSMSWSSRSGFGSSGRVMLRPTAWDDKFVHRVVANVALPFRVHHEGSQAGVEGRHRPQPAGSDREICRSEDIEILQGHVRLDHVHLLLSAPPQIAPSGVMQAIKGRPLIISCRIIGRFQVGQRACAGLVETNMVDKRFFKRAV
jgi:hypothetical protein